MATRRRRGPKSTGLKEIYLDAIRRRFDDLRFRKRLSKKRRKQLLKECRERYAPVYELARAFVPVLRSHEDRNGVRSCVLGRRGRIARNAWLLALSYLHR